MKHTVLAGIVIAVTAGAAFGQAADAPIMPDFPEPTAEHAWLTQLAGEWESEVKVYGGAGHTDPSQPPTTSTGTEAVRSIGGFWIIAENHGNVFDTPFTGVLTLGYDPEREKFVGTWIDSITSLLWQYEGSLDADRRVLTLNTEGPGPTGEPGRFRETIELKSADHKVFTSQMLDEDGKWFTMMKAEYRRVR